jgi:hypothetical protein
MASGWPPAFETSKDVMSGSHRFINVALAIGVLCAVQRVSIDGCVEPVRSETTPRMPSRSGSG